jgi:hypothetical protein
MIQPELRPARHPDIQPDFESRLRLGLSEVLHERPELREVLPLAALMDDALRWCA